jgi:hypothetical protein
VVHYRFYRLDADYKIFEGVDAECVDDQAAYSEATSRLVGNTSGEIWSGTRYIGRIPTQGEVPPMQVYK